MEAFFNELSLNSENKSSDKSLDIITNLKECYRALKDKNVTVCRVSRQEIEQLLKYLQSIPGVQSQTINNFFYSFFKAPFEAPDNTEDEENTFIQTDYCFNCMPVEGLAWAVIKNSIALSLLTDAIWDTEKIKLQCNNTGTPNEKKEIEVKHVSKQKHVKALSEWMLANEPVQLIETPIKPNDKICHLRNDHGKDELMAFWKKIKKSPYIEKCVNSLEFNPHARKFIEKCTKDGYINLRLLRTQKGLGLCIKTTGRTIHETAAIAQILEEEYR